MRVFLLPENIFTTFRYLFVTYKSEKKIVENILKTAKKIDEENKIDWITNVAKKLLPEGASERSIARCTIMLDTARYGFADHFIRDYSGGLWDYYSKDNLDFVVYDCEEPVRVINELNYTAFEILNVVTASAFIWIMTLAYVASKLNSSAGYAYAEDVKYLFIDNLEEGEVAKLVSLLD